MSGDERWTRRRFLSTTAAGTVAAAAGCGDDDGDGAGADAGADAAADASTDATADAGADAARDAATDVAADGSGDAGDATDAGPRGDAERLPVEERPVRVKGPFMHIDHGGIRWSVETEGDATLTLVVRSSDDRWQVVTSATTEDIEFRWPPTTGLNVDNRDLPGTYSLHTIRLDALPAGERVEWTIRGLREGDVSGSVRVPVTGDVAFRAVWVADTMYPTSVPVADAAAAAEPDLLLHGGDIQYQSNPLDTWNGYFLHFGEAMRNAPMHYCIGNHEYEDFDEIDVIYGRLFGVQGDGPTIGYHAFTWGAWRFLMLNSEEEFATTTAQGEWLIAELEAVRASSALRGAIVAFHRPYYTFGGYQPNLAIREDFHTLFTEWDVPLVLCGHNHSYERFEVDGITYIVDGGGGAALSSPNEHRAEVEAARPEELALQVAAEQSFGILTLDFGADGRIDAVRTNSSGQTTDSFSIEAGS